MEKQSIYAPKIITGINVIDEAWGGLYRGGSYLLYGQAWTGRSLMNLQFAFTGVKQKERCLYIFPERPRDLIIQAASINFDLRGAVEDGLVKLMRIPPSFKPNELTDEELHKAITDLVQVVAQENPDRLIIDNFSRFAQFKSFAAFQDAFIDMLERIELVDTTLLFALGEPANDNARNVIEFIARQVTGCIHVALDQEEPTSSRRLLTIIPNIGHLEGPVADYWDLAETVSENERYLLEQSALQQSFEEPEPEVPQPVVVEEPVAAPEPEVIVPVVPAEPEPPAPEPALGQPFILPTMQTPRRLSELPRRFGSSARMPAYAPTNHVVTPPPVPVQKPEPILVTAPPPAITHTPVIPTPLANPLPSFENLSSLRQEEEALVEDVLQHEVRDYTDRAAFQQVLEHQFRLRDQNGHSFLLIAMRMDRGEGKKVRPFDFEFILDLVTDALRNTDSMLVNHDRERLVMLRTNIGAEESQSFFTELMGQLRKEAPQQAEHLLRSVSAIVVPDGKPFKTAEEFLAYAMDRP
ncbi:MAG: hypothetical protein JNN12_05290 [Bacteroidetes Order II. Incertae sedis bacterium]|nr:hypothetical protein [Bacteroidetes Order II. bacterium]